MGAEEKEIMQVVRRWRRGSPGRQCGALGGGKERYREREREERERRERGEREERERRERKTRDKEERDKEERDKEIERNTDT
jgi:hypothetical protein